MHSSAPALWRRRQPVQFVDLPEEVGYCTTIMAVSLSSMSIKSGMVRCLVANEFHAAAW